MTDTPDAIVNEALRTHLSLVLEEHLPEIVKETIARAVIDVMARKAFAEVCKAWAEQNMPEMLRICGESFAGQPHLPEELVAAFAEGKAIPVYIEISGQSWPVRKQV